MTNCQAKALTPHLQIIHSVEGSQERHAKHEDGSCMQAAQTKLLRATLGHFSASVSLLSVVELFPRVGVQCAWHGITPHAASAILGRCRPPASNEPSNLPEDGSVGIEGSGVAPVNQSESDKLTGDQLCYCALVLEGTNLYLCTVVFLILVALVGTISFFSRWSSTSLGAAIHPVIRVQFEELSRNPQIWVARCPELFRRKNAPRRWTQKEQARRDQGQRHEEESSITSSWLQKDQ